MAADRGSGKAAVVGAVSAAVVALVCCAGPAWLAGAVLATVAGAWHAWFGMTLFGVLVAGWLAQRSWRRRHRCRVGPGRRNR